MSEIVILLGLAGRAANNSRKYHHFTEHPGVHYARILLRRSGQRPALVPAVAAQDVVIVDREEHLGIRVLQPAAVERGGQAMRRVCRCACVFSLRSCFSLCLDLLGSATLCFSTL